MDFCRVLSSSASFEVPFFFFVFIFVFRFSFVLLIPLSPTISGARLTGARRRRVAIDARGAFCVRMSFDLGSLVFVLSCVFCLSCHFLFPLGCKGRILHTHELRSWISVVLLCLSWDFTHPPTRTHTHTHKPPWFHFSESGSTFPSLF